MVMEVLNQGEEEEIGISEGSSSQTDIWPGSFPKASVTLVSIRETSKEREAGAQRDKGRLYWKEEKEVAEYKRTQIQDRSKQKVLRGTRSAQQQPKTFMGMCSDPLGQELPLAFSFQDFSIPETYTELGVGGTGKRGQLLGASWWGRGQLLQSLSRTVPQPFALCYSSRQERSKS